MFFRIATAGVVLLGIQACSGGSSSSGSPSSGSSSSDSSDCTATKQEIHDAAVKRGLDPNTVCSSTDPVVMNDFAAACAKAKGC